MTDFLDPFPTWIVINAVLPLCTLVLQGFVYEVLKPFLDRLYESCLPHTCQHFSGFGWLNCKQLMHKMARNDGYNVYRQLAVTLFLCYLGVEKTWFTTNQYYYGCLSFPFWLLGQSLCLLRWCTFTTTSPDLKSSW